MARSVHKIGANVPCPCGRNRKFKACCRGRVDWESIIPRGLSAQIQYLSTQGKNVVFLGLVLEALQLDTERGAVNRPEFKRAFTSKAVKKIFEAVEFVWPSGEDLKRVLTEDAQDTSGLYIGHYRPELIPRAIARHSLYADRILLVDPLIHPSNANPKYSPLLHPEMHRTSTLQWITLWLELWPWIHEGLIAFVRSPGDFYPSMAIDSYEVTTKRFTTHPELERLRREYVESDAATDAHDQWKEHFLLVHTDDALRRDLRKSKPDATSEDIETFIEHVHRRREAHAYYLEPEAGPRESWSDMWQMSTGTNYELAKAIALHSKSYVMTDLPVRWKEIEIDRADSGIDSGAWSPFAKAFQGLPFRFLDHVPLDAALTLRREGRLQTMRDFLRKTWNGTNKTTQFDDTNITNFGAELAEKLREAESEWQKIDTELATSALGTAAAGLTAAGPAIAHGYAEWLGAAVAVAGAGALVRSYRSRTTFKLRYPAGFFVDLEKQRPE